MKTTPAIARPVERLVRLWRRISGAESRTANRLVAMLSSEMIYKADCFDYLCWLEETHQSENVKGTKFLVLASDGLTCWGNTYSDAVKVAMKHDKELYDEVQKLEMPEVEPNTERSDRQP